MDLCFDTTLAQAYTSNSQKIRVLSEHWVNKQIFCPNCGQSMLTRYANNKPVADFYCSRCHEDYELKSKDKSLGTKIVDGAYRTMIERLQSSTNPNFFILNYSLHTYDVINFLVIPKHFFVPSIIEQRKPLAQSAHRAGWIGCNINLRSVPDSGRIFFVKACQPQPKQSVLDTWQKTLFLRDEKRMASKGWILDTMNCIQKLGKNSFSLTDIYAFESELSKRHPDNHHVLDKIRQQLQVLRDQNYLKFTGRGNYRLT